MFYFNQRLNLRFLFTLFFSLLIFFGCTRDKNPLSPSQDVQNDFQLESNYRGSNNVKLAIFSDPHLYDPSLGTSGAAFQQYITYDRKMIAESQAIMEAMVKKLRRNDIQYVLVPGDLTKDGEQQSHMLMANYLAQIESSGKQVFVVPGNHDIDNPHAFSYPGGDFPVPVPTVTSNEFKTIYMDYGYGEALYLDPNSLSYIAEPQPGLWLLGLDGCNYEGRFPDISLTNGRISNETKTWLDDKLTLAEQLGITVFAFMHHGAVEHFPGMETVFPEYLIDGWMNFSQYLQDNGVHVVFTGHHHANDIAIKDNGINSLYDIQTGSLVTWPCPYRVVHYNLPSQVMNIKTHLIENISYNLMGMDFQSYAYNFLASGMPDLVIYYLQSLGVPADLAAQLEPLVTPTLMAYYHGDEPSMINPDLMVGIMQLINSGDPMAMNFGYLLYGIWTDASPDIDVNVNLINCMYLP